MCILTHARVSAYTQTHSLDYVLKGGREGKKANGELPGCIHPFYITSSSETVSAPMTVCVCVLDCVGVCHFPFLCK